MKPDGLLLTFASTVVKLLTIWLTFVYAFSATGASVHLHYCCGKLQHLAVESERTADHDDCKLCRNHHQNNAHPNNDGSQHCASDIQSDNHCQDIRVDAQKTTGDHLASGDKNLLKIQSLDLPVFTLIRMAGLPTATNATTETANAPPLAPAIPLFIQHCTFRI